MWRSCLLVFINSQQWCVLQPHAANVLHCLLHKRKHCHETDRGQVRLPPSVSLVLLLVSGYVRGVCTVRACIVVVLFMFFFIRLSL